MFCNKLMHVDVTSSCFLAAHEDSLWSCAWAKNERDGSENIVTGGVDDLVKIWKW